jgi:hypothetical protein
MDCNGWIVTDIKTCPMDEELAAEDGLTVDVLEPLDSCL